MYPHPSPVRAGRRRSLRHALAVVALACMPLAASAADTSGLRCHYRLPANPDPSATGFSQAPTRVEGYWHNASILLSRSMFFTDTSPAELEAACRRHLSGVPTAGQFIGMTAATSDRSYNYEFWFNGDLKPGAPIERVVAFGDSLSDTGNMYNESQWKLPSAAWFAGRFSNGPTWVENLAANNGLVLNNWAIGGAQTKDAHFGLIHGIGSQIESFRSYVKHARGYDPSRTLFTFLVAGNDFVNDDKPAPAIVAQQEEALYKLAHAGARKILIVNLPDLSRAPVFRMGRKDAHTVLGKVEYYNARIGDVAARVAAATGATIRVVDARSSFDELMASPDRFGFRNASESCLAIDDTSSLNYIRKPALRPGCRPDDYVFWDTLHPTARVHRLMAEWAVQYAPAAWGLSP